RITGGVAPDEAVREAFSGITQMIDAHPSAHFFMFRLLDWQPRDNEITQSEFEKSSLAISWLTPDVSLDGELKLSIGFHAHLTPCADGRCTTTQPAATCFDRVRNGDETDVDCGGTCGACSAGATCAVAGDCQTPTCDGTCAAPTCSDGVRDGFET